MWTRLARDIGEKVDSARSYALPLAERRYLAYSVFCGRLWYLAQTALPTSRFIRPVKSALYSFFWSEKTELVTRPVVCLPRERGGWGFPCIDIAPAVLQLKTMLKILRDEHGPARSLALYFVGHSRRELGVESPSSPGPCAETPPSDYRRAIQLFKRLKERAPQLDVVETPTARLTEVLLEPQISATQVELGDSFSWSRLTSSYLPGHLRDFEWQHVARGQLQRFSSTWRIWAHPMSSMAIQLTKVSVRSRSRSTLLGWAHGSLAWLESGKPTQVPRKKTIS
ncbi:hypothetical protein ISCGN_009817 [Ixodes scapularis]